MTDAMPRVKGFAFETTLRETGHLRGPEIAHDVVRRIGGEASALISGGTLVAAAWYPIAWYRALLGAIRDATGEGPELLRLLGHRAVHADMSTLHRSMLRLLSPKTITQLGARYFGRVYDTGSFSVVSEDESRIEARFVGCRSFDRNMWTEISGSIEGFVELAGGREVTVRITDGGRDEEPTATMVARWSSRG